MTIYEGVEIGADVPALVVLVAGLVLLASRRTLTSRARALASAGCIVLLLGTVLDIVFLVGFVWFVRNLEANFTAIQWISAGTQVVLALLHALGVALVLAALLAGDRPPAQSLPAQADPSRFMATPAGTPQFAPQPAPPVYPPQ